MPSDEKQEASERSSPGSGVVYEAVLKEGSKELERPSSALMWSAIAAGLSMGLTPIAQAFLQSRLPESDWRPLVAKIGYSLGYLVVILGRQQLYTENTLTAVLPVARHKDLEHFGNMLQLWAVVLAGNLVGAAAVAWYAVGSPAFTTRLRETMLAVGREAHGDGFGRMLLAAIVAGWMIALIVWLLPFAETARFWVVLLVTYMVGIGELPHVIAGSVEMFMLAFAGEQTFGAVVGGYIVPVFIGNTIGGVTFVALLNHAQVVAGTKSQDA